MVISDHLWLQYHQQWCSPVSSRSRHLATMAPLRVSPPLSSQSPALWQFCASQCLESCHLSSIPQVSVSHTETMLSSLLSSQSPALWQFCASQCLESCHLSSIPQVSVPRTETMLSSLLPSCSS